VEDKETQTPKKGRRRRRRRQYKEVKYTRSNMQ
jgi:hypothetical protein